ncbi:sensor histidine kinase [Ruminiclostridium papyrosolvens]|uniref:Sensor histidine kinase NatK-like C-terminal domain-containing protein n=1 Tax=Ruminiclostridium papyrosolvens C7 TaxID=1330534 RepID=U4R3L0_9FIRM|nr:GHKL domain-containing protein [Ruminiclostridium papyrosolvens]EPR12346.1 hypothetical protein L323_08570 [Ruminiclostridium papyrosolvens C7]
MIQNFLINTLFPALTAVLVYMFLKLNFRYKRSNTKITLFIFVFGVVNGIISTLWMELIDMTSILQMLKPVTILIISIIMIKVILKVKWVQAISSFLLIFVAFGIGNIVAAILLNLFGMNITTKTVSENSTLYLISNISAFVIALIMVFTLSKILKFRKVQNLNSLLVLFCVIIIVVIISSQTYGSESNNIIAFSVLMGILIFFFVVILVIHNMQQQKNELQEEMKQQSFYNQSLEETLIKLRGVKHDAVNHNETLRLMLKRGNTEEALAYLNEFQDTVTTINTSLYNIKNVALHAIISAKLEKATQAGIRFEFTCVGEINVLSGIKISDFCELIGIYLDNAIESAEGTNEKIIEMQFVSYPSMIEIKLSNSCKEIVNIKKINQDGYSTKGSGRGHGLAIANQILSKYKCITNEAYFFDDLMRYEQNMKIKKTPV